ncbi:hypothetical protein, partial [Klebsiella pneumoniae]|uniref:hypothetical protein n=1 Tax=Klebsiella pneumoniae TaxID=573 RepID=UPI003B42D968
VSEEAEEPLPWHGSPDTLVMHIGALHLTFRSWQHVKQASKPVYTPLVLRDGFRVAPLKPLTTSQLLDIITCHLNMMIHGIRLIRSFPANMTFLI